MGQLCTERIIAAWLTTISKGIVYFIWPELKLELELKPTKILELELELGPKNVPGIGIGINYIFSGMSKCLIIIINSPWILFDALYY